MDLTEFYKNLKAGQESEISNMSMTPSNMNTDNTSMQDVLNQGKKLEDAGANHILTTMYTNMLPHDDEFKKNNPDLLQGDIDSFLASKNKTPIEYLRSCKESSKAPFLDLLLNYCEALSDSYVSSNYEIIKRAKSEEKILDMMEADFSDSDNVAQTVDLEKDMEYSEFMNRMRENAKNQIIADVSSVIKDTKGSDDLRFDPQPQTESGIREVMNTVYYQIGKRNINLEESADYSEKVDEIISMCVRESTLNLIDRVFRQPADIDMMVTKASLNKGVVINESSISKFLEADRLEPLYQEVEGNKYDVKNFEKINDDGSRTPMSDSEVRKLGAEHQENFRNRQS